MITLDVGILLLLFFLTSSLTEPTGAAVIFSVVVVCASFKQHFGSDHSNCFRFGLTFNETLHAAR